MRPLRSGRSTTIWRSKRPGRSSAGSRMSGRLVAAMRMMLSFISKPSISTSSWLSVCSRSSWPPPRPAPRWRPTASISSMKMMQGEFCLACSNRSRTREAPTPTNISTKSEPEIEKNGHARLARDGAREQRLAGAGRAVQQHALGDARPERLELLRVLEELLDLLELLDRLVDAGHVAEGDLGRVDRHALGARLAEGHDLRPATLHLVDDEQPEQQEDHERQDVGQGREPARSPLRLDRDLHVVGPQLVDEVLLGVVEERGLVLAPVLELHVDPVVLGVERDALDLAVLDLGQELRVVRVLLAVIRTDQLLGEKRQHDDDQNRKCRALEESAHELLRPASPHNQTCLRSETQA